MKLTKNINITLPKILLKEIDEFILNDKYIMNRSELIKIALIEYIQNNKNLN